MTAPRHHRLRSTLALGFVLGLLPACGDDGGDVKQSSARGVPGGAKSGGSKGSSKGGGSAPLAAPGGEDEGEDIDPGPERPPVTLDEKSFSRRRDPFRTFVTAERVEPEPDTPRAARKVKLGQYGFEDLRLVIIVNSARGIQPRAQFVAGDGRSGTVMQGEYFSSAEVLLAAVNRDYVEVEVVDEELAANLGLKKGERRSIFLRTD